jgi:PAS domain S-box-containing protein
MSPPDTLSNPAAPSPSLKVHGSRRYWSLCALVGGLALTAVAYSGAKSAVARAEEQRFVQATDGIVGELTLRLHDCERVLSGARSLLAASQRVERNEWEEYTAVLDLPRELPGLRGLGFVRRVARADLAAFEAEERASGSPSFSAHSSGDDAECWIVQFMEPAASNPRALGLDLSIDPVAREALAHARDTGHVALSAPLDLDCPGGPRLGLLMLCPVFQRGAEAQTPDAPPKEIVGWVHAALDIDALAASDSGQAERTFDYSIVDATESTSRSLVYASNDASWLVAPDESFDDDESRSIARTTQLAVSGRKWLVRMRTRPAFHAATDRFTPLVALVGGTLVSLFLWILVWSLGRARVEALKLTDERTHDLRQTESSLRAKKAELEALHDASPLGMFYMGPRGDCVYTNRILQQLLGLTLQETLGDHWASSLHPEDRSRVVEGWTAAFENGTSLESFHRYVRRGGDVLWTHVNISPVRAGERVIGFVGTIADFTARKAAEERLLQTTREALQARSAAEASARAKTEFLANMSHELRTPLTSILGYTDLLLEGERASTERGEWLETVKKNGQQLLSIIDDILEISSLDPNEHAVERTAVSPLRAVEEVLSRLAPRAKEKSITLRSNLSGPVPESISTDPARLRLALLKLVGNAIKFTERGGVTVDIEMSPSDAERLEFRVVDTGPGMRSEEVAALFQPFQQADASNSRRHGGIGLGLVMSKRLATLLGGDVRASCVPAQGCTFTLTIATGSLDGVRRISPAHSQPPAALPTAAPARLEGRVLLADDGRDNQRLIAAHLARAGVSTEFADDGRIAVDKALAAAASGRPFDLILMDMQMPELDGYAAASELRARGYAGSIVALTARALAGDREQCLAAGCNDYATKPIDRDALLSTCARWMHRSSVLA